MAGRGGNRLGRGLGNGLHLGGHDLHGGGRQVDLVAIDPDDFLGVDDGGAHVGIGGRVFGPAGQHLAIFQPVIDVQVAPLVDAGFAHQFLALHGRVVDGAGAGLLMNGGVMRAHYLCLLRLCRDGLAAGGVADGFDVGQFLAHVILAGDVAVQRGIGDGLAIAQPLALRDLTVLVGARRGLDGYAGTDAGVAAGNQRGAAGYRRLAGGCLLAGALRAFRTAALAARLRRGLAAGLRGGLAAAGAGGGCAARGGRGSHHLHRGAVGPGFFAGAGVADFFAVDQRLADVGFGRGVGGLAAVGDVHAVTRAEAGNGFAILVQAHHAGDGGAHAHDLAGGTEGGGADDDRCRGGLALGRLGLDVPGGCDVFRAAGFGEPDVVLGHDGDDLARGA